MESRVLVVNQLSPKITQGIAPTLILIRVSLGFSNVLVNTTSFTEPGRRLQVPADMSVSEIKSKPSSRDLGSALSSVEDVASAAV